VAQLYPQAPGSLFATLYDSEKFGGSIVTRLHTGLNELQGCIKGGNISLLTERLLASEAEFFSIEAYEDEVIYNDLFIPDFTKICQLMS
jgi:hypothetical protein